MRAKRILQRGAFTPEDFARVQRVFDDAWATVAPTIPRGDRPQRREMLATIVLSLATARSDLEPAEMTPIALRLFGVIGEVA